MSRILAWFRGLSNGAKVVAVIVAVILFVWTSPVFVAVAGLALIVGIVLLVVQASREQPLRRPLVFCAMSAVALVAASGISLARYVPTEPPEQAETEPINEPKRTEASEVTQPKEDTRAKETTQEDEEPTPKPEEKPQEPQEKPQESQEKPQKEPESKKSPRPEPQNTLASFGKVVTITRVVDGDTVEVSPAVNGIEDVRLIGMDTPEFSSDCGTQPMAQEAADFLGAMEGRKVALEFDEERIDPYSRVLAYVRSASGGMVNETLVREGYAQVATFPPNVRYESDLLSAQSEAQAEGAGIWGLGYDQQQLLEDRGNGIGGGCMAESTPTPSASSSATASATASSSATASPEPDPGRERRGRRNAGPAVPPGGDVDCSDFASEAEAAPYLLPGDPYDLDGDNDGRACEPY